VDRRYLLEAESRQGFREDGALAFTTSVGGPLSHIVCSLLRGGHQEQRPPRQRRDPNGQSPISAAWEAKARLLRVLLPSQLRAVPRLLTDEIREIAAECRTNGRLRPEAAGLDERRIVDRLKEALRVSLVVLSRPTEDGAHRTVCFVGPGELQDADFVIADSLRRLDAGPGMLPFWTVR